ncbi:MAG: hypothetical protein GF308_05760 [Candidatus Heimdallarchaeota archaeon]|nr:hypothetical protein [Candidatus Heimdallarchaeota archaeon]
MNTKQPKKLSIKKLYQKKLKKLQKKEEKLSELKLESSKKAPLQLKIQELLQEKNNRGQEIQEIIQKISNHEENSIKQLQELEDSLAKMEQQLSVIKQKITNAEKVDVILYEAGMRVQPKPGFRRIVLSEDYQGKWHFPRVVWLSDKAVARGEPYLTLEWAYENWEKLVEEKTQQIQAIKEQKSKISQWKKDTKKARKKLEREHKRKEKQLKKLVKEISEKRSDYQKLDAFDKLSNEVTLAKELLTLYQEKKKIIKNYTREIRKIERKLWKKDVTRNNDLIGNKLWEQWSQAFVNELFTSKKIIQPIFTEILAEEQTEISGSIQFLKGIVLLPSLLQRKLNKLWDWLTNLIEESPEEEITYLYLNQKYFSINWLTKQRIMALTKVYDNLFVTNSLETAKENPFVIILDHLTKKQQKAVKEGSNNFRLIMTNAFEVYDQRVQKLFSQEQRIHDRLASLEQFLDQVNELSVQEGTEKQLHELIKQVEACGCTTFSQDYLQPLYQTIAAIEDSTQELRNNTKLLRTFIRGINKWQRKVAVLKEKEMVKKTPQRQETKEKSIPTPASTQPSKKSTRPKVTPKVTTSPKPSPRSSQSKEKVPEICPRCGGKIVESSVSYNDFLGTEIAEVVCENNHKEIIYLD